MAPPALLRLVRWPGVVTAAADAAAAAWVFRGEPGRTAAAAGAAALLYAGGVVLNDVADAARDRSLHPGRPLPAGEAGRGAAAGFGAVLLAAGLGAAALGGTPLLLAYAAVAAAILLYDFALKRVGPLGVLGMALCRGGSVLAAGWAGPFPGGSDPAVATAALAWPLLWAGYTAALTGTSLLEEAADAARAARMRALVREGVFGFLLLDAVFLGIHGRWPEAAGAALLWAILRTALRRKRS